MCDIAINAAITLTNMNRRIYDHISFSIYYGENDKCCDVFTGGEETGYTISLYDNEEDFENIKVSNQDINKKLSEIINFSEIKYIMLNDAGKLINGQDGMLIYEAPY